MYLEKICLRSEKRFSFIYSEKFICLYKQLSPFSSHNNIKHLDLSFTRCSQSFMTIVAAQ